jgi:hypothetical protein
MLRRGLSDACFDCGGLLRRSSLNHASHRSHNELSAQTRIVTDESAPTSKVVDASAPAHVRLPALFQIGTPKTFEFLYEYGDSRTDSGKWGAGTGEYR